ncbi:S-layer homology domain-containing protein [Bacillus chungangensis]|uniref:Lysophospholipase L1-like esterase n=1 Tax=Bacillus chungangensis TaxID=587633 RepID=A0ABT9WUZ8_9BACI|nr:S-layer homology domain-containing protein [Bacillus chungangensis]MDQ0177115.1 lysophospholipase L1-like esterase [Bacillus chungangensis]
MKKYILLFIVLFLIAPSVSLANNKQIHYVSLGDSLAAGQTPNKQFDLSYGDYLANHLKEIDALGSFDKRFAVSGYTTKNVLDDMIANIERPDVSGNSASIQDVLANATYITISAGANDLLQKVIDDKTGSITIDLGIIEDALKEVHLNTSQIIAEIKKMQPNAVIHVMGYYNPLPHLPERQQLIVKMLLHSLNQTLQQAANHGDAIYVSTAEAFNENAKAYLPNPLDIHPNREGYLVIANRFWQAFNMNDQVILNDQVPVWAEKEIAFLTAKGIIPAEYELNDFGSEEPIKRLHAASMIKRSLIFDLMPIKDPGYIDMKKDMPGYGDVAKLSEHGILTGENGYFYPERTLTRAEAAKIIVDAFHLKGASDVIFSDTEEHWAKAFISILAANDLAAGYPDGSFKPDQTINKAEFSYMLAHAMGGFS